MPHSPAPASIARDAARAARLGVVVVDPLHVVQTGLATLIDTQEDMRVLARAGTAPKALASLRRVRSVGPVVVLVGLSMEGERDAFWLIETLRRDWPAFSVVACGYRSGRAAISRALFAGADGYLDHRIDPPEFLAGVRRAAAGDFVVEGVPADWLGPIAERIELQRDAEGALTEREAEVLTAAAEGLTARQIALRLGVRERTVTTHLGNIYAKLGASGRIEAITTAAKSGLVTVGWEG